MRTILAPRMAQSEIRFFKVILHLAWLVISLRLVRSSWTLLLASILTVCQLSSLKVSTSPFSRPLSLVLGRAARCQFGPLDSTTILDIWKLAVKAREVRETWTRLTVTVIPSTIFSVKP